MLKGFTKIGEYREPNTNPVYVDFIGRSKTKKLPIVYLFVVNDEIKYIGETRQGYFRPLSYNKNFVMKRQQEAILNTLETGNIVEVFAITIPCEKMTIN